MEDYDILIQKGYRYIKFKDKNEFNKYSYISRGYWFDEDGYYAIKDSKYSQWNVNDGEGKTIDASQIEEELKLNLDDVLKIMESKEWRVTMKWLKSFLQPSKWLNVMMLMSAI